MISLRRGFLFIHVPKTGGNSLQSVLAPHSDDRVTASGHQDGRERFEVRGPNTKEKHATMAEYARRLGAADFERLFKFACVRDPLTRIMSFYFSPHRWYRQRGQSWVQDEPVWSRQDFIALLPKVQPMVHYLSGPLDDVIRFESFVSDAERVLGKLKIKADIPHLNSGPVGDYERHYDAELKALVRERFAPDFAAFYP
jgi:hypothetical protein